MPRGSSPSLPFRPQLQALKYRVKRQVSRVDCTEVRAGRALLERLREDPPDVLYLGDSTTSYVGAGDEDRRRLHTMIEAGLPGRSVHSLHGGSYHAGLYDAYVRLIGTTRHRPLVIVPLCVRVATLPWIAHPVFGHERATRFLAHVDPHGPLRQVRLGLPRPTEAEFAAFYRLPHHTFAGDWTVGDHVSRLKDPGGFATDDDRVKLLYAHHHGGRVDPAGPRCEDTRRLGRRLRDLGCPTVAYQTPVPVEAGSGYWGPAFTELAAANLALLDEAFAQGRGEAVAVLQTGRAFGTEDFIDPADASEHLNQRGRLRLAEQVVAAVLAASR